MTRRAVLTVLIAAAAALLAGPAARTFAADPTPAAPPAPSAGAIAAPAAPLTPDGQSVLYHVVSVKFKEAATKDQVKAAEDAFAALKDKVPGITSLHWGTNVSPEKRNKGYTHCFVLTFATEHDRDAYLTHPDHKALGKVLGPAMEDVMVVDFWSKP